MGKQKYTFLAVTSLLAFNRHRSQRISKTLHSDYSRILVLSSGGTMGLAWQLATLEKYKNNQKFDPNSYDLTIGTSAGSIAALMLGSKKDISDISKDLSIFSQQLNEDLKNVPQKFFTNKNWRTTLNTFSGFKFPHFGMLFSSALHDGQMNLENLENYINDSLNNSWPDRETWVMVANTTNGKREILHRGSGLNPGTAAIASSAVPALFHSISHGSNKYIDGGIISSSHLDLALRLKAKEVTMLTISNGFTNPFQSKNLLTVLNKLNQNIEELNIIKAKIWGIFTRTKITIIRPTPTESKILRTNRLMDSSLLEELVNQTLSQ